jgi:sugar transferase (PEP-CTERM system associated)
MPAWSFNNLVRTPLLLIACAEIAVLYSALYVSAILVYGSVAAGESEVGSLGLRSLLLTAVTITSLISMGLYHFHQRVYFYEVAARVFVGVALGAAANALIIYMFPSLGIGVALGPVAILYALVGLIVLRFIFMKRLDENLFRRRALVYGAGQRASAISSMRRKADRRGFKIVGYIPAPGDDVFADDKKLLDASVPIEQLAADLDVNEIIIAMDDRRGNFPVRDLLDCKLRGFHVIELIEFLERETGKIAVDLVNPAWLIFSSGFGNSRSRRFSERTLDLVVSGLLALLTWPVMLAVMIAIKIEDGWRAPVLYRQTRIGFMGKPFEVLKFRSMCEDAEADGKAVWAQANDSRITRVGRTLRSSRLDELPQVFNVVGGQMSLVGPRPERPEFVTHLSDTIPYYAERHTVKPGVTGWAQLRYAYGSSDDDALEKLQYDLYYVKNHNILLDIMVLLQTVEVILWGKGAR